MSFLSLYESMLDGSPAGHYLLTPSTDPTILAVNSTFLKTVGRERSELVGKKLFDAFPANPDDPHDSGVQDLRNSFLRVIETGQPDSLPLQSYPIKVTGADGVERYEDRLWRATSAPVFDEHGQLLYISHHTNDVTEGIRAQAELLKTQNRYRGLTESIDEGFCVLEVIFDEGGKAVDYMFQEINPLFEIQTGLHNSVGKNVRVLVPDLEQHWFDIYGEVARSGKSIRFEDESKAMNRWFDVYAYRINEPGGNLVGVLFKDITRRKLQEDALRTSEGRLRSLIMATADTVYRLSPDWMELRALEGRSFLRDLSEGEFWMDEYIPAEDRDLLHTTIARAIRDKAVFELEHRIIRADASYGWTYSRAVPMLDAEGEIYEWVGAASDITERKLVEEKLRETDRRKDEFLAMLAHELRNPLAPISAAAELLGVAAIDEARVRKTSAIISRQVRHMTGLVDDLLDVSRVTRGLVELNKTAVDVKKIVADSVEQVRPLIEARGHHLTFQIPPQPAWVFGDQKRLVQVLANLLNNAAKYTPHGGEIVLSMQIDDNLVTTTVSDNGIGMAPGLVKSAFEMFTQAARSSDRSQGGLGIGLALVKSLVELHDGSITASSPGAGQGSRFTVCLPRLNVHAELPEADATAHIDISAASVGKIMVVDDNVDAAHTLAMLVEASGHQVFVEFSSRKALERAKVERPSICLLDVGLPDMDGKELARRLRAQPETANAILIAITGYGQERERTNAENAGFDHYFVKPVDAAKLISLLNQLRQE